MMSLTTENLVELYESKESSLAIIFKALRNSRKVGFRLCRYKASAELNQYHAAVFCFSLIDNVVFDALIDSNNPEQMRTVQSAIQVSPLLKSHVQFVLSYSPVIDCNDDN